MSFVVYIAVVLVAVASAVFGLDLLTAPLPPKPRTQVASTSTPTKLAEREAPQKQQADTKVNNRTPSPVVRVNPVENKDARTISSPPAGETTGTTRADTGGALAPVQAETKALAQAAAVPQQPQTQPKQLQQAIQPVTPQMAAVTPEPSAASSDKTDSQGTTAPAPATEPVAQQAAARCNVQACASAYSSFRDADCTYQPLSGARRLCSKPSVQKRATASVRPRAREARAEREARSFDTRSWDARRNPEVDDAVRGVRRMPYPGRYDDADLAGPVNGRRTILIERSGRFWP